VVDEGEWKEMNGEDIMTIPSMPSSVAPTIAQQTYIIASGLAGGAAGMVLAFYLAGKKEVPTKTLVSASVLSAVFTFIPALIIARDAQ
jgi:VIT1/CCC1 family predicted Fe2+/Mn2+ transporter